jgi:hypothetical protein
LGSNAVYLRVVVPERRRVMLDPFVGPCDDALPVIAGRARVPVIAGDGEVDHLCTRCLAVVCEGIAAGDLVGLRVRCSCGAVNVVT